MWVAIAPALDYHAMMSQAVRAYGRPPRNSRSAVATSRASVSLTVRLTEEEADLVDGHVKRLKAARSVLIREAMLRMGLFAMRPFAVAIQGALKWDERTDKSTRKPQGEEHASVNVTIRLTAEERSLVDAHVHRTGFARAVLIREAMSRMGLFGRARVSLEQD